MIFHNLDVFLIILNGFLVLATGIFVLGQEQDGRGSGFSASESFVGRLANVNVWRYVLNKNDIKAKMATCEEYRGDVWAWPDFLGGLKGKIQVSKGKHCSRDF